MKKNIHSYCHDCGKQIEGEEFYCAECLAKNNLDRFSVVAFIMALIQPLLGLFLMIIYPKSLNPGIFKAAKLGFWIDVIVLIIVFISGFVAGLLGMPL